MKNYLSYNILKVTCLEEGWVKCTIIISGKWKYIFKWNKYGIYGTLYLLYKLPFIFPLCHHLELHISPNNDQISHSSMVKWNGYIPLLFEKEVKITRGQMVSMDDVERTGSNFNFTRSSELHAICETKHVADLLPLDCWTQSTYLLTCVSN